MLCSRNPLHRCCAPDCSCCGLLWVTHSEKCGPELFGGGHAAVACHWTASDPATVLLLRHSPPHPAPTLAPRCAPALCAAPWCASSSCRLVQWMWSCCMMPRGGRLGEGDQPRPTHAAPPCSRPPLPSSSCSLHCCFLAPSDSSPLQRGVSCKIESAMDGGRRAGGCKHGVIGRGGTAAAQGGVGMGTNGRGLGT